MTDLTRDEFRVYDNERRRIVDSLWFDTDQPLTLGVIIDASESQREQIAEHRQTVLELLQRVLRPGDKALVIAMDQDVRVWADVAGTVAEIRKRMDAEPDDLLGPPCARRPTSLPGVRQISECGDSPLWDAIYETARLRLRPLAGNKALLILTDGFDTGSTHTWRQAADEAERAEASIYTIQYKSDFRGRFARDLSRLLEEAGGAWFSPPAGQYDAIVARIETDLRRRYVLGFRPDSLSGRLRHDIRVEVIRPDVSVRARKTYFQPSK